MTVIAACSDGEHCWVGGDAAACWGSTVTILADPKVWRHGQYLIGASGQAALCRILKYSLSLPVYTLGNTDRFAQLSIAPAIADCIRPHRKGEATVAILVAFSGVIYTIDDHGAAERNAYPYDAVGGGSDFALASLMTSARFGVTDCHARVETALQSAADHCDSVRSPFTILSI